MGLSRPTRCLVKLLHINNFNKIKFIIILQQSSSSFSANRDWQVLPAMIAEIEVTGDYSLRSLGPCRTAPMYGRCRFAVLHKLIQIDTDLRCFPGGGYQGNCLVEGGSLRAFLSVVAAVVVGSRRMTGPTFPCSANFSTTETSFAITASSSSLVQEQTASSE